MMQVVHEYKETTGVTRYEEINSYKVYEISAQSLQKK